MQAETTAASNTGIIFDRKFKMFCTPWTRHFSDIITGFRRVFSWLALLPVVVVGQADPYLGRPMKNSVASGAAEFSFFIQRVSERESSIAGGTRQLN